MGRIGGSQSVSLGPGCMNIGIIQHEFLHVLGFWHQQSRLDRDKHIKIIWENIQKGKEKNFKKVFLIKVILLIKT